MSQQDRIKPNKKLLLAGLVLFFCLSAAVAATAYAAAPNAPSKLTATTLSSTEIRLSWKDNSSDESGFIIVRSASASGPFNQIGIMGANATTYSNYGLTPKSTYYYRVFAYNSYGNSGYSNVASATTASNVTAPVITTQPSSQTVILGKNVTFSISASGTAPLTYQWKKGSSSLTNGGRVSGTNTAILTIATVAATDAGSYSCLVTNSAGKTTSAGATLTVSQPPTITTQPVNQTVNIGDRATFSIKATGTTPLAYQWQKKVSTAADFTNIPGATSSYYAFTSLASDNGAQFRCTVTNIAGSVTSSAASLTVNVTLTITARNGTVTKKVNGQVTTATSFNAGTVVGLTATANSGYSFSSWSGSLSGSANPTTLTMDANKTVTANFTVQIQPPTITTQPSSQTVILDNNVTFKITSTGTAPLAYQWQKKTSTAADFTNISGATSASYTFTPVTTDNGAQFRCVVTNSAGSVTSNTAGLTVNVILLKIDNIIPQDSSTFLAGTKINIQANVSNTNNLVLQYQFSIGGTIVQPWSSSNTYVWQTSSSDTGSVNITCEAKYLQNNRALTTISYHIINPSIEEILQKVADNYALVNDKIMDVTMTSRFGAETVPFGETIYTRHYFKKSDKQKTETFSDSQRTDSTKTEIHIVNGPDTYLIDPRTSTKAHSNILTDSNVTQQQLNQMDEVYHLQDFLNGHFIVRIDDPNDLAKGVVMLEAIPKTQNNFYSKLGIQIDYLKGLKTKTLTYLNENNQAKLKQTLEITDSIMLNGAYLPAKQLKTLYLTEGNLVMTYNFENIQLNTNLADALFDPERQ